MAIMAFAAIPGQIIGDTTSVHAAVGDGTHIHGPNLMASVAGPQSTSGAKAFKKPTRSIVRPTGPLLPGVGTTVLGRITRTTRTQAHLSILALGETGTHVLNEALPALIRQQDIRATEVDKVKVAECFRVGDVVRAVVISLGDERSYYASTARNELGVVMAVSEQGVRMVPVSWREFEEVGGTGRREGRKVGKVV